VLALLSRGRGTIAINYQTYRALFEDALEDELSDVARQHLGRGNDRWTWRRDGVWIRLCCVGVDLPAQGWKLHVAATSRSAVDVLRAVMPILLAEEVTFKFVATRDQMRRMNTVNTPRQSAGKFVTVYPSSPQQAVRVAAACDAVTAHLAGPAILSDRPYRPGSLVHYRFGGFREDVVIDDDGAMVHVVRDPSGHPFPDQREAWFAVPPWAANPFPSAAPTKTGGPVLLNGRYLVREALKHSNKGGVYLAEDDATGATVVLKEARPHVEARGGAGDVIDVLHHERRVLDYLSPHGVAPRVLDVFEQQGHAFLVLEHLPGETLYDHVVRRFVTSWQRLTDDRVLELSRRLAALMDRAHAAGVLVRDFNPNNVMVLPDDDLCLVDLELAHILSDGPVPSWPVGTPGYASPEQIEGCPGGLSDDYFSLGATVAFVATGCDPFLLPEDDGRTGSERMSNWFAHMVQDGYVRPGIAAVVRRCLGDDASQRLAPAAVGDALDAHGAPLARRPQSGPSTADLTAVPAGVVHWLERTVDVDGTHLWPTGSASLDLDPCNVHSGASGVGLFLCQVAGTESTGLLRTAATWVAEQVESGPTRAPGLYFGVSGAAWFLAEAANRLDDEPLLRRAGRLASTVPLTHVNLDLTHGTAGIGLGQLHHWMVTDDARFLERAERSAGELVARARPGPHGVVWPVDAGAPTEFAGLTSYGFAHGSAGIVHFLLGAASATGERRFEDLALDGLETLVRAVRLDDDTAWWEAGPGRSVAWPHWCNGSPGIGTTLVRGYVATGDTRFLRLAEQAANAAMRTKWRSPLVQCHGLAGNAELLLDLHATTGDDIHRVRANELAQAIWLRRVERDGTTLFPDDSSGDVTASFGTGMAGIGSFFLRLVQGTPRPLMLDELLRTPAGV
jgi:hypothetical protein